MASVFIFGAGGFVGGVIAQVFQSKGYIVYGLTRSEQKAKMLKRHEIHAIVGKSQEPASWLGIASSCQIIVESMADYADQEAAVNLQKVIASIVAKDQSKLVIYTSGVWVYGNTDTRADENGPYHTPALVQKRPALEKLYTDMGAVVFRPGCVYGYSGSLTGQWFNALKEGKAQFPGHPENTPVMAMVHANDVASAYLLAAEKSKEFKGQIFNIISQAESVLTCLKAAASVVGYKGEIKFVAPQDPFSECLSLNQAKVSSQKLKMMGWNPMHEAFSQGADRYYASWLASQP